MRALILAALATAAIAISTVPADAAWRSYVSKDLGLSFIAPGEVKAELGTYRGAIAGPRQTFVFTSTENNIAYKVTVMSFVQSQADGAAILGEREYMFQDKKVVLMDAFARVGSGKNSVYGRKIVVDLPMKKGRTTGAFFFTNGRLYAFEATVLPANGDYASPDPARFIDSIRFALAGTDPNAVELHAPKVE